MRGLQLGSRRFARGVQAKLTRREAEVLISRARAVALAFRDEAADVMAEVG